MSPVNTGRPSSRRDRRPINQRTSEYLRRPRSKALRVAVLVAAALVTVAGCKGGSATATVNGHKWHISVSPDGRSTSTPTHTVSPSASPGGKGGGGGNSDGTGGHGTSGSGGSSPGSHSGGSGSHGGAGTGALGYGQCTTGNGFNERQGGYLNAYAVYSCATMHALSELSGYGTVARPETVTIAGTTWDVWGGRAELASWNAYRAKVGERPLIWSPQWAAASIGCSIYQLSHGGIRNCANSDIFAWAETEGNPAGPTALFWASPPHKALMVVHSFTMGGAAIVRRAGQKASRSAITGGPGFNY
jgi:hypothetical protein